MIICAHRGGAALAEENTRAAFEAARDCGCPWIETDVRVTADGVAVLHHDPKIDGTDIFGIESGDLPETVLSLDALLTDFGEAFHFDIELKTRHGFDPAVALIKKHGLEDRVLLTSFDHRALAHSIRRNRHLAHGALVASRPRSVASLLYGLPGLAWIAPHWERLDRDLIEEAHALGLKVATWTVPQDEVERLRSQVDALIVDDPRPLL